MDPRTDQHLVIARYFEAVTEVNSDATNAAGAAARYNEEWVERANPLIVGFFSMTHTLPSQGDVTPWCAGFVSFVLAAAGKKNLFSALSGAYRSYTDAPIDDPQPGDLAVFEKKGPEGKKGHGHVGFFIRREGDDIFVLGGNQKGQTGSTGAVTTSKYKRDGATLKLHTFHRVE